MKLRVSGCTCQKKGSSLQGNTYATLRHLTPKSEQNVHLQVQIENDDPMLRHAVLESDEDTKRKESAVVIPPQEVTPEKNACRQAKLQ